jgi:uncharacterized protein DUF3311
MAEEGARGREEAATRPRRAGRGWFALLLLPFLALLYPPLYAHEDPRVFGIPFFYWYQFAWLLITAAITTTVYRRTR